MRMTQLLAHCALHCRNKRLKFQADSVRWASVLSIRSAKSESWLTFSEVEVVVQRVCSFNGKTTSPEQHRNNVTRLTYHATRIKRLTTYLKEPQ